MNKYLANVDNEDWETYSNDDDYETEENINTIPVKESKVLNEKENSFNKNTKTTTDYDYTKDQSSNYPNKMSNYDYKSTK
jgi:hypothetical protein